MATLTFLGATGTVTGSKFLLEHRGFRLMVDCGLFQGLKELRLRNWAPLPVAPADIDLLALTHAHLDHTGYLPVLTRDGYERRVVATAATCELCGILLPDCGHLQEEDARFANKRGYSKHRPARPLYTEAEARESLVRLDPKPARTSFEIAADVSLRFLPAGHITGSAFVEVRVRDRRLPGGEHVVLFSGDLGRPNQPIVPDPDPLPRCDTLVLESTYGDRRHPTEDPKDRLAEIIARTVRAGGVLLIPAFAVGRTQTLLYLLRELQEANRLPTDIPIHVDSPMAIEAIRIVLAHPEAYDREMHVKVAGGDDPLGLLNVHLDETVEQSKALNDLSYPAIILSASGMAEGGRILHHLAYRLGDHRSTVLFVGYQAAGTRGRALQDGARTIRMHGREIDVRARIETLEGLSAHADGGEILAWLDAAKELPRNIHLVHGEPHASAALAEAIRERHPVGVNVPGYLDKVDLR